MTPSDLSPVPGLREVPEPHIKALLRFANEMAGWYQAPVYLCGSALKKAKPRDIDLRVHLPDEEFGLRYGLAMNAEEAVKRWVEQGATGEWTNIRWRWSDDCVKRTKRAWKNTNLNVDFQVYPESYALAFYKTRKRVRLDTWPGEIE